MIEGHLVVCWAAGETFLVSIRPNNFKRICLLKVSQSEMNPGIVAAQIALSWVDPTDPLAPSGVHFYGGAIGIAPS